MKICSLLAVLVLALGSARDARPAPSPDYATPESTLRTYWLRMLEHDHDAALRCFIDYHPEGVARMHGLPSFAELRPRDFTSRECGGGQVDVSYRVEYRATLADTLVGFSTGDRMQWTSAGWKIARPILIAAAR